MDVAVPYALPPLIAAAFLVSLATVVVPGPITIVATRLAIAHSIRAAAYFLLGVVVLDTLLFIALVAGAGPPLRQLGAIPLVELLGGLVLLWVGLASLRSEPKPAVPATANGADLGRTSSTGYFMFGIALAIGNPHYWIWWVTAGLAFIEAGRQHGTAGLLWMLTALVGGVMCWYLPLLAALHRGRTLLTPQMERLVVRGMGVALVTLGLALATLGGWRLSRNWLDGRRVAGQAGVYPSLNEEFHKIRIKRPSPCVLVQDRQCPVR